MSEPPPIGERVARLEVSLLDHVHACEKKHDRVFRLGIAILGIVLLVVAKQWGWL